MQYTIHPSTSSHFGEIKLDSFHYIKKNERDYRLITTHFHSVLGIMAPEIKLLESMLISIVTRKQVLGEHPAGICLANIDDKQQYSLERDT